MNIVKYQPVIVNGIVYHTISTIAQAFNMREDMIADMVHNADNNNECIYRNKQLLIPWSVFMKIRFPQEPNLIWLIHSYKYGSRRRE